MDNSTLEREIFNHFAAIERKIDNHPMLSSCGRIAKNTGMAIEVTGLNLSQGHVCKIYFDENRFVEAEVIGFNDEAIMIMPYEYINGIEKGMAVMPSRQSGQVPVGDELLGRVVNSLGQPIDGKGEITARKYYPLYPGSINPLERRRITDVLDVGVRAINGLITTCQGQRMGIFAESGMGKSVLLGMMTKFTSADVVVVGLIGERGREVKEFIEEIIGLDGLTKACVVVAPSDSTPLMKVNGAAYANSIAEYYRNQGKNVLLIIDSLTRYAQAWREITLSNGELPSARGYTPSVFAKLSQLVERSGNGGEGQGSITSYYTVLVEGEELSDPVAEHVRSLIDGHIVLSRYLAESGHFPAIDVEKSVSRLMTSVLPKDQIERVLALKRVISAFNKNKDLIHMGMYQHGSDKLTDIGYKYINEINRYLVQSMHEKADVSSSMKMLEAIVSQIRI